MVNDGRPNGDAHGDPHECAPQAGAPHACEPHADDTSTTAGTTPACAEAIANMTTASTNFLETEQKRNKMNIEFSEETIWVQHKIHTFILVILV